MHVEANKRTIIILPQTYNNGHIWLAGVSISFYSLWVGIVNPEKKKCLITNQALLVRKSGTTGLLVI